LNPAKDYHQGFGRAKRQPEAAIEAATRSGNRNGKMKACKKIFGRGHLAALRERGKNK
jgi:hypothetical protein